MQVTVENYLRKQCVKVVLSQYLNNSLKWIEVAQKMGIRFFAHSHGYDVSQVLRDPAMQQRYLRLKKADGIITMSEYSRNRLLDVGLTREKYSRYSLRHRCA